MKFKLLSIRELSTKVRETVTRFPLLTFFLCVGATNHLYINIYKVESFKHISRNIFMSLLLLVPALYSARLFHESKWIVKRAKLVLDGILVIGAGFYFYYLPDAPLIPFYLSQFAVLLIGTVLVCFVCVRQEAQNDDFYWQFHAALIVHLAITGLYTLIILGGTSAALGAIDSLFKTTLFRNNEIRILIITLWLFAPMYFLSGVPNLSISEEVTNHRPKWLKGIGIYVMVPLTAVYLAILYAYGAKILFQWQLPEGTVSYLVLSFASFGIITLLVIFPFQEDENSKWCYWFSRYFYFLQFPLLFLLFDAIFTRVLEYGVTFRRYYVLALAVWLLFITLFMVIRRNRNLIVIPFSLLLVAVLSLIGPWSSFDVSYKSQTTRLLKLLQDNNLIENGKIVRTKGLSLPLKLRADISSIATYLYDYGKLQTLSSVLTLSRTAVTPEAFTEEIGFAYLKWHYNDRSTFYYHCENTSLVLPAAGYQVFVRFREPSFAKNSKIRKAEAANILVEFYPETAMFRFSNKGAKQSQISLKAITEHFRRAGNGTTMDNCNYHYEDRFFEINCLFERLEGWEDHNGMHFYWVSVDFLIREK